MTTLFVASTGGHLAQLVSLAERMVGLDRDRLWVSYDCEQTRTLLVNERKIFVPFIMERNPSGVLRAFGHAREILRDARGIDAVVSTGSSIALAFLPYAACKGIETHYIESAARVGRPSMTGRVLQRVPGVKLYRQYPHVAVGPWRYGGSVFDGFTAAPAPARPVRRVVVTVGTDRGFSRLIDGVAALLPPEIEVLWQTGHTPLEGLDLPARPFVPASELEQAMRDADVVIAHAGCGSALTALSAGKRPLLVPRDPAYGEVVDTHQLEIAHWLKDRNLASVCEPERLSLEVMEAATAWTVERVAEPPPFELSRTQ